MQKVRLGPHAPQPSDTQPNENNKGLYISARTNQSNQTNRPNLILKLGHTLQNLHIPPRLLNRPQRRLTQPPLPIRSLQLPPRLRLTTPTRRHPRQNPPLVRLGEIHKAKRSR